MSAWLCSPVSTLFFPSVDVGDHCRTGMIVPTLADHSLSRGGALFSPAKCNRGKTMDGSSVSVWSCAPL